MGVLTVVGPPGVGKTYLAKQFAEKLGDKAASYHLCPASYDNPAFNKMDYDALYEWAFEMTHLLAQREEHHVFILDGFPHPEAWAFAIGQKWEVYQKNMEQRLRILNTRQLIVLPSKWKKWESMAVREYMIDPHIANSMRDSWDQVRKKTELISAVVINNEMSMERIDQLTKGIGVST